MEHLRSRIARHPRLSAFVRMGALPFVLYLLFFCALTYPLITHFFTDCLCTTGDGYQYYWNLWWINKAITQLHQTPWQTLWLFYPRGMPLIVHDLAPMNGFIGIFLLRLMPLFQAYNLLLVLGFVLCGLVAFWLAFDVTQAYIPSLLAGFIFTFSNDHFAHAILSHLTIITMYWLPLFMLCWYRFICNPSVKRAVIVAAVMLGVTLTSFYFLSFCVLAGVFVTLWQLVKQRDPLLLVRPAYLKPLIVFIAITALTSGPLVLSVILLNRNDPVIVDPFGTDNLSGHNPADYSVDVLGLFTPGGKLGSALLSRISGTSIIYRAGEHDAYLGILVWAMFPFIILSWRKWHGQNIGMWFGIWLLFLLLSFGPVLHVAGSEISSIPMPYNLLGKIIPIFTASGTPARATEIAMLAAGIICAFGFKILFETFGKHQWLIWPLTVIVLTVMAIDALPLPLPITHILTPQFVTALENLPDGAVIDDVTDVGTALYYQTIHEKPIAFAYVSRATRSVGETAKALRYLLQDQRYERLCPDYGFRYLVESSSIEVLSRVPGSTAVYSDPNLTIYDLGCKTSVESGRSFNFPHPQPGFLQALR